MDNFDLATLLRNLSHTTGVFAGEVQDHADWLERQGTPGADVDDADVAVARKLLTDALARLP